MPGWMKISKEKLYWQKFKSLKAVKHNRIYVIDADKVCRPAPLSFLEGLNETIRLMHPEVFKKQKRDDLG